MDVVATALDRAALRKRWIALSLALHLAVLIGYGVPILVEQYRARQRAEAAAVAERARAEEARAAAERAKHAARERAMHEIAARVHDDLARQLDADAAKRLDGDWDAIERRMADDLGRYADDLGQGADGELRDRLAQLEAEAAGLAADDAASAQRAHAIEDAVARAAAAIPALADGYRKQVGAQVRDPVAKSADEQTKKSGDYAEQVREALDDLAKQGAPKVDDAFAKAFGEKVAPGVADAIVKQERGEDDDQRLDDATAAALRDRLTELLAKRVPEAVAAGTQVATAATGEHQHGEHAPGDAAGSAEHHSHGGGAAGVASDAGADDAAAKPATDAFTAALAAATAKAGEIGAGDGGGSVAAMLAALKNGSAGKDPAANGAGGANAQLAALARDLGDGSLLAGEGAAGIAGLRHAVSGARGNGRGRGSSGLWFDAVAHKKLTDGIHERDVAEAQGEAADAAVVAGEVSHGEAATAIARSPVQVVPPENAAAPVTVAAAQPYQPRVKTIAFAAAPYAARGMRVDGDLSDWDKIPALELHPNGSGAKHEGAPATQRVQVAWDRGGLYVAATVADVDGAIRNVQPANFWEGDGCEIFIDARNTKDRHRGAPWARQFWVWTGAAENDAQTVGGEAIVADPNQGFTWRTFTLADVQRAAKPTANGWNLEFYLPARLAAGLEMRPGRIVGLNLSICTGTEVYYYWGGTSDVRTSDRPDTWGDLLLAGSDGRIEAIERDATSADGSHPARAIVPGQPLTLRVTDPDRDLDAAAADKLEVVCTTDHGDQEIVVLGETGPSTGVFEGSIATALALGEDVPGTLSVYEGEHVRAVYTDTARADGSRLVDVTLDLTVSAGAVDIAR